MSLHLPGVVLQCKHSNLCMTQCCVWAVHFMAFNPKTWLLISTSLSPAISNVGEQLRSLCARTPRNKPRYFPRRWRNVTLSLFANAILLMLCSSHLLVLYQWPPSSLSPPKTNPISDLSKWQAARRSSQNIKHYKRVRLINLVKICSNVYQLVSNYEEFHKSYRLYKVKDQIDILQTNSKEPVWLGPY